MAIAAKLLPRLQLARSGSGIVEQFTAARTSVADRMAEGKALRAKLPRASLAEYKPFLKRKDPVAILEAQAKTRLPQLIPVRYARMLASPFAFLRGGAAIMAQDLSPSPSAERNLVSVRRPLFHSQEWRLGQGFDAVTWRDPFLD